MINFGLFHSGCKLSFLRYLSFKSLRHFHPNSKIQLYFATKSQKNGHNWNREKQDFETYSSNIDYIDKLKELDIEVIKGEFFSQYAPNYGSDFFRWWFLKNQKNDFSFYLDTDQLILKSFDTLPLDKEIIYSQYFNPQCGPYCPVGVIGAKKDSKIVNYITENIMKYFNLNDYNCIGPRMFLDITKRLDMSNCFNTPSHYFYPAQNSDLVTTIYDGTLKIPEDSYSLHFFLGHPISQNFNNIYTEEMAKTSNDVISVFLREKKLL
jgi:hypothetical protein